MIKKLFILTILVIILVSLNWFKTVFAQDLNNLSESQKELLKQYQQNAKAGTEPYSYSSSNSIHISESSPDRIVYVNDNDPAKKSTAPLKEPSSEPFENLHPFGMELFTGNAGIDIPNGVASASDYILGPGDNVIIYLWGRVEKEYKLAVDREGKIFVPKVGEIICWGLTMDQFTKKAKKHFSKVYSEFDITISLGKIRSIQVYITGEVNKPGAYSVSSLTSLFDALNLAGGPNERGSMRKIRLMRSGKAVTEVDLYRLLLEGDNTTDVRLENGDVIFVPVAGPQVAIRGEIKRSAVYELLGEETAEDLIILAGNPTPQAHLERVMLERISEKGEWEVIDINLKKEKDNISLTNGDRMTIYSIYRAKKNVVAIHGHVKHAGYYERNDSLTLKNLIEQARLQDYDVYYPRADLFRRYSNGRVELIPVNLQNVLSGVEADNIHLNNKDSLHIYSIDDIEINKYVYVEGEVKNPGRYPLYENMTVNDLIFLAGSYTRSAFRHQGEIARIGEQSDVDLISLSLENQESLEKFLVEDDHLYIRRIPQWVTDRTVNIRGEIVFPGKYTLVDRGETLWQLIQRAGGLTNEAFIRGLVFKRASIKDNLDRLNVPELIEKSKPITTDTLGNLVKNEMVDFKPHEMERIIIDVDKIVKTNGKDGDIVLQPNDDIYIPSAPSGISVIGAVSANGTVKYAPGESVKYYLSKAGGYSRHADKKQTRLVKATGEVITKNSLKNHRVDVGDVIIIPTKIERQKNWSKTISMITGILTSAYIVSKI